MKSPDEEFDRNAHQRGLEGREDLFENDSNQEGLKKYDERQAERAEREEDEENKEDEDEDEDKKEDNDD